MIELIYLVLFLLASFSAGRIPLKLLKCRMSFLEEVIFSITLGFIVISLITFFLGIFGLIYEIVFNIIFLVLLSLFIFDLPYIYNKIKGKSFNFRFNLDVLLVFLLIFLIVINLIPSMAPPWGFDETGYLTISKIYIKNHAITYQPQIFSSNFPFLAGMIYMFGMVLKNAILSRMIAYSFNVLFALGLLSFCRRFFSKRVGLISAIILLTVPVMMEAMTHLGTDILTALFCFLGVYSFLVWYNELKINWLILSGVMLGAAFSTKYTGILIYIPLFLLLLFRLYTLKEKISIKLFYLLIFCILPFLIFFPWMLKSYIYTGNPVFPFLYNLFGGKYLTLQNVENFRAMTQVGFGVSFKSYLFLFWNMAIFPLFFGSIMGVGPVFLAFIPLLILIYRKNKTLNFLLVVSFLFITSFFLVDAQITRYGLLYIPFLCIIAAFVIDKLLAFKSRVFVSFILLLLLLNLVFSLSLWGGMNIKTVPVVFGFESEGQFYNKLKDYSLYDVSQFVNKETPLDSKILIVKDGRGLFLDREFVPFDIKYSSYVNYLEFKDKNELLARIKELKITHMLINNNFYKESYKTLYSEIDYYPPRIDAMFRNITSNHAVKIYDKNDIEVFELK